MSDWQRDDWMQTYSGIAFYPYCPPIKSILLEDIAHALSLTCRYNGHTRSFYSVAEHAVLVSQSVPERDAAWGLMHDAAEAYIGDMVSPVKLHQPEFRALEDELLACIAERFSLNRAGIPVSVHEADTRILLNERGALLRPPPQPWAIEKLEPLPGIYITGWSPETAERRFLARATELGIS